MEDDIFNLNDLAEEMNKVSPKENKLAKLKQMSYDLKFLNDGQFSPDRIKEIEAINNKQITINN